MLTKISDNKVACSFSNRKHGNMSLFYGDIKEALDNRDKFLAELGIDYRNLVCPRQVHGGNVKLISEEHKGRGSASYDDSLPQTDSLITDVKNLPLAIFTADCLSVFLYDSARPAVAAVHAGWKSTRENILAKTIELMQKEFGTKVDNLHAELGPRIKGCCYEVGNEFRQLFSQNFLFEKYGRLYLDLSEVNKAQLLGLGMPEGNIYDSGACTYCNNDSTFSFRKEGVKSGRMMSVIMLRE